jgi:hypothetical protein
MASSAAAKRTAQTRVVVGLAVLLAIIVFLTFTKPRLSQRSEARQAASAQQSILETEQERAGKYSPGSENVKQILSRAALLDSTVIHLPGESAEADLLLNVRGIVNTALASLNLQSLKIGEPSPGTSTTPGLGLMSMQVTGVAAPGQIKQLTSILSAELLTTISGVTISPASPERAPGDSTPQNSQASQEVAITDAPLLNWSFTLNIWYAKEPGVASVTVPAVVPSATTPVTTP